MTKSLHYRACHLCEAICGLAIETETLADGETQIRSIKGDPQDGFSRGHICPKAVALQDIPVSYTHLDVYKRQLLDSRSRAGCRPRRCR